MPEQNLTTAEAQGNSYDALQKSLDESRLEISYVIAQMDFLSNALFSFAESPHQLEGSSLEGLAQTMLDLKVKTQRIFSNLGEHHD